MKKENKYMEKASLMLARYSIMYSQISQSSEQKFFDEVFKQKEELVILIALWLVTLWAELKSNPLKPKE